MVVLFLMSIVRLYPGLKLSLKQKELARTYLEVHVTVGILDLLYVRWTKNLKLVKKRCYSHMVGRWPNSGLLGHKTGLLFCFYVKLFLPSIFNLVDLWSSILCFVLDIELAKEVFIEELWGSLMAMYRDIYSVLQKWTNPESKRNLHKVLWNSGRVDNNEFPNILPRVLKSNGFANRTEDAKILGSLLDEDMENLDCHGCPKVHNLVDKEMWLCST